MADTIASLGLRVDSSQVAAANPALDKLAVSAERAATAEQGLANASTTAGAALQSSVSQAGRLAATQAQANTQMGAATLSAKQYSQALRLLPAQITDIVTGLASGQSPFIVAIQQGGQLRDSFGGFGATLKALGTILTPFRLTLLGAAAAGATLFQAFREAQAEAFSLERAIVVSGNAAGITAGQLALMATEIDRVAGTRAQASEALAAAVTTGRITAESLQRVAELAIRVQRTIGQPIEETIKQFAALGERPTEAVEKLNRQYNFLTAAIHEQVRALEQQGRFAESSALATDQFATAMEGRVSQLEPRLGSLQRAWRGIASAAKEAWDAMLDIGRAESPEEELVRLQARLEAGLPAGRSANLGLDTDTDAIRARVKELQALVAANKAAAAAEAARVRAENEAIAQSEERRKTAEVRAAAAGQIAGARLGSGLGSIRRELDASLAANQRHEQLLDAQRRTHLITETEYYEARRKLVEGDRDARIAAFAAENRLLQVEQARIRQAGQEAITRAQTPSEKLKAELAIQPQIIANQDRITANEIEMATLRKQAISAIQILGIEQTESNAKITRSYQDARAAAEQYLETIQRRQRLELEGVGAGQRARDFNAGRSEIDADFERQRQELAADRRRNQITQEQYDQQLALINEFQAKALKSYDDYWGELTKLQGSFFLGATEALRNYIDEAQNTASQVADALSRGFDRATDALVQFVMTGKGSFKELANSIIADLLRIQLQKSLASALDAGLGALFGEAFGGDIAPVTTTPTRLATGTSFVPRDNFPALLHRGEAVIPAKYNPAANPASGMGGNVVNINSTLNVSAGASIADFQQALDQRNEELEGRIHENLWRRRWPGAATR